MLPRALLEARPEFTNLIKSVGEQGFSQVSDLKNKSKIEGDGAGKIHGILLTPLLFHICGPFAMCLA